MIKPDFIDGKANPLDKTTYEQSILFLENLLKLIHPWMPFISEELWHSIRNRNSGDCIIVSTWPAFKEFNKSLLGGVENSKELIASIRNLRQEKQISPKEPLSMGFTAKSQEFIGKFDAVLKKLANLTEVYLVNEQPQGAVGITIGTLEFFIPLGGLIDEEAEKEKLQKELEYLNGFLESVMKKLSNEKFVNNAKPEIIEVERKKKLDAETKISIVKEQLKKLN